jgi:hypothetical protein
VSENKITSSSNATIGGGGDVNAGNVISDGDNSFIGAGRGNTIYAPNSAIGGGVSNKIDA